MAINKNHEFEDLDGVKCAIVEKNALPQRVEFLKRLLEYNRFTVVVIKTPSPKVVAKPVAAPITDPSAPLVTTPVATSAPEVPLAPETLTVGVTDVAFNATNAIFGRLLHTPDGNVVTLAFWNQRENKASDEIPYYENKNQI